MLKYQQLLPHFERLIKSLKYRLLVKSWNDIFVLTTTGVHIQLHSSPRKKQKTSGLINITRLTIKINISHRCLYIYTCVCVALLKFHFVFFFSFILTGRKDWVIHFSLTRADIALWIMEGVEFLSYLSAEKKERRKEVGKEGWIMFKRKCSKKIAKLKKKKNENNFR